MTADFTITHDKGSYFVCANSESAKVLLGDGVTQFTTTAGGIRAFVASLNVARMTWAAI